MKNTEQQPFRSLGTSDIEQGLHKYEAKKAAYASRVEKDLRAGERENRAWVDGLVDRYEKMLGIPLNREGSTDAATASVDYLFFRSFYEDLDLLEEEQWSPIESRIARSDLLILHYLFVGGGIEEIYRTYCETNTDNERNELEVKAELAGQFLERLHDKHKEFELLEKFPHAPTTGFEFEYKDRLRKIIQNRNEYTETIEKEFDELASEIRLANKDDFEKLKKRFADILTKISQQEEDFQQDLHNMGVDLDREDVKQFLAHGITKEGDEKDLEFIKEIPLSFEELTKLIDSMPNRVGRLSYSGAFHEEREVADSREFVSSPAASPRMLLRDFLFLKKQNLLEGSMTVHQTVAGIELSPEHPDFMEVRALLEGAKFIAEQWSEEDLLFMKQSEEFYKEVHAKPSLIGDTEYYFPFHRVRQAAHPHENEQSKLKPYPAQQDSEKRNAVEERSFSRLQEQNFRGLVRHTTFTWLAAWGWQAYNKSAKERGPHEIQLAQAWEELQTEWQNLLSQVDITQPSKEDYSIKVKDRHRKVLGETESYLEDLIIEESPKYPNYLDAITVHTQEDRSFQSECRKIITRYNKKVKTIIGY